MAPYISFDLIFVRIKVNILSVKAHANSFDVH